MNDILVLPGDMVDELIAHARGGYPEEVCGLIAGRCIPVSTGGEADVMVFYALALYRGRNVHPTPRVAYELDIETLVRQVEFEEQGLVLAAIYHSHPAGPETPSATDIARAAYPDSVYLICSLAEPDRPVLRGFRIMPQRADRLTSEAHVWEVAIVRPAVDRRCAGGE